jgi:hypothetical protein
MSGRIDSVLEPSGSGATCCFPRLVKIAGGHLHLVHFILEKSQF